MNKIFIFIFITPIFCFSLTKVQVPDNTKKTKDQIDIFEKNYKIYEKLIKVHALNILVHTKELKAYQKQNEIEVER